VKTAENTCRKFFPNKEHELDAQERRIIREMKLNVLKVGIVGVGAIGRTHIERINNILQGANVTACSDVNAELGKSVAETYGCKFYEDGEAMIASEDMTQLS